MRYKTLAKEQAQSIENYQNATSKYFQSQNQLSAAMAELWTRQVELELCHYWAEYDCIVDKILLPWGVNAGEAPVAVVSQLNPMGIEIKMDVSLARKITPQSQVTVYPMNSDKPLGIINLGTIQNKDGVTLRVLNNRVESDNLDKNGEEIPTVHCHPALRLYSNKEPNLIGVPVASICKDENGSYVWKAVGQASGQPGKGIDKVFQIQKVYIAEGKIYTKIFDYTVLVNFTSKDKNNTIKEGDLVLIAPDENLKNNDSVCYYKEVYTFMPGDKIKVEVDF